MRKAIAESSMHIEIGPASIVVEGRRDGIECELDRAELEGTVTNILRDLHDVLPIVRQKAYRIKKTSHLPSVARRMVEAVKMVDEETLTPMAAVAGSVADEVKEFLKSKNLDVISVNNGGDISVFTTGALPLRVGIGDVQQVRGTDHVLTIDGLADYGLATSGLGGRSFTLGLADSGTVVASTCAVADAAATFICNRTTVESDSVVRAPASEIDPLTDIPEEQVTVSIGDLPRALVFKALENGIGAAHALKKANVIYDALLLLRNEIATTVRGDRHIRLEVQHGI